MKKNEFWKLYNEKYKHNIRPGVSIQDKPVGGDSGTFVYGCFQNEKGIWCIEETKERSNTPYHTEYASEDEAFETFIKKVHRHSTLDEAYIKLQKDRRERFEKEFLEQLNGPDKRYISITELPPRKKGWPRAVFKTTCYLTDWGQWYIEEYKDGPITRTYYDTLEEAKEVLYKKRYNL